MIVLLFLGPLSLNLGVPRGLGIRPLTLFSIRDKYSMGARGQPIGIPWGVVGGYVNNFLSSTCGQGTWLWLLDLV